MAKSYYENPANDQEESKNRLPGRIGSKRKPDKKLWASPLLAEALEAVENMAEKTIH